MGDEIWNSIPFVVLRVLSVWACDFAVLESGISILVAGLFPEGFT